MPRHVGFIPDGNRRWADARGLPRRAGYAAGIEPGIRLLDVCRKLGVAEVSIYGFTKENVRRPADQVQAFREACAEFGRRIAQDGAALLVVGDASSPIFPQDLLPFAGRRAAGDLPVNLLVNYGWRWDLSAGIGGARSNGRALASEAPRALASGSVSRIDLVVRWGGRHRLSGFLPVQCAYADLYVLEDLWPDMQPEQFFGALEWYQRQDVTMGG